MELSTGRNSAKHGLHGPFRGDLAARHGLPQPVRRLRAPARPHPHRPRVAAVRSTGQTPLDAGEAAPLRTLARSYPKNPLARITALGIDTYEANLDSKDPIEADSPRAGPQARGLQRRGSPGHGHAGLDRLDGAVHRPVRHGHRHHHRVPGHRSAGGGGLGAVSAGIAEALIVTAVGLVVAIASVLFLQLPVGPLRPPRHAHAARRGRAHRLPGGGHGGQHSTRVRARASSPTSTSHRWSTSCWCC